MIKVKLWRWRWIVLVLLTFWHAASEATKPAGFFENLRYTLDLSGRPVYFEQADELGFIHFGGFDVHKVVSGKHRDIGTFTLQGYITRRDDITHFIRDDSTNRDTETEFVYRIFNFNYRLPGNLPNIKVGHFEVPYGLEQPIGTNGTLRQLQSNANLGIKADWGLGVNKIYKTFNYEVAYTTGGGQDLNWGGRDFTFSGRVGSSEDNDTAWGISLYRSRLGEFQRNRVGVDFRYFYRLYGLYSEVSFGDNNNSQKVLNSLWELNYRNRSETTLVYTQLSFLSRDGENTLNDRTLDVIVGWLYNPTRKWTLSAQVTNRIERFNDAQGKRVITAQYRYRF